MQRTHNNFIVEPLIPHKEEFYLYIVSDRLGNNISFLRCGRIEIEENWDMVKNVFVPTECLLRQKALLHLLQPFSWRSRERVRNFLGVIFTLFQDLDFTFLEMHPFTLVNGKP